MEKIILDQIPTPDDKKFLESRGVGDTHFIKLVHEDGSRDELRDQLISKGWNWVNGFSLADFTPKRQFYYCIGTRGVAHDYLPPNKTTYGVPYIIKVIKANVEGGIACPSCGTIGGWIGLMMKCPNCWKTW